MNITSSYSLWLFNSSLRFNLIARFSKIPDIYQYPLFSKNKQHITDTPKKFLKNELNLDVNEDPSIQINDKLILDCPTCKTVINDNIVVYENLILRK